MPALSKQKICQLIDTYKMSPEDKRVALFGAGNIGHAMTVYCRQRGIQIACIADNNPKLWGNDIDGITIIPVAQLKSYAPFLIILSGDFYKEMAAQLDADEWNNYLSYFLFKDLYDKKMVDFPEATSVERAYRWILQNQQKNGGVSVFRGSPYEYPEVTGYIIPTMLQYGFRDEALTMAQYLSSVANADGSFTSAGSEQIYLFDTAQALRGLNAIRKITSQHVQLQKKTAEYLFSKLDKHTGVFPPSYENDPLIPETIMLFALPPMLEYARMICDTKKEAAVHAAVRRYLQEPDVLSLKTLTHFLAYQIDGLIDLGYAAEVKNTVDCLLAEQREGGAVPAFEGAEWICITGCSQIAITFYKLGLIEPADRLMAWVEQNMEVDGGFLGSVGPGAEYLEDREPSWAVKFYLDAYKRKIAAHFDQEFARTAPEEIARDDAEVLAITGELHGDESVLEVGCGKGRILKRIQESFPLCRLEGIDISREMLACVPRSIGTTVGDMEFLPYEDDSFDLVYAVECIEHSVNMPAAVKEVIRVCKPGGKIVIIDKQLSNWGWLETSPWERWPDREQLELWLKESCTTVQSDPIHPRGCDERDDLFIKWTAIK